MSFTLNVSANGILRSLEDQFSSKTNFLSEALQNARRAGATAIHIDWEPLPGVMTIRDNGNGVADFNDLFMIGESNWDMEVLAEENPFGIGFASCIIASNAIEIRSANKLVCFFSKELLRGKPTTDCTIHYPVGTELKLWVRDSYIFNNIQSTLEFIVKGFPVPVYFNGIPLQRSDALSNDKPFVETPLGTLHLPNLADNNFNTWDFLPNFYFQGLPIKPGRRHTLHGVMHLNNHEFRPRVPDRDVLIDQNEQEDRIIELVKSLYKEQLVKLKSSSDPQQFVEKHWEDCIKLGMSHLLDDLPICHSMLEMFNKPASAVQVDDVTSEFKGDLGTLTDWVECSDSTYCGDEEQIVIHSVYAMQRGLPRVTSKVPRNHRLIQQAIPLDGGDLVAKIEPHGEQRQDTFQGYAWFDVVTCDSYTIHYELYADCAENSNIDLSRLPSITIDNISVFDHQTETLIVPKGDQCPVDALVQVQSYEDEWGGYQEELFDSDYRDLGKLIDELRVSTPEEYINLLLQRLSPNASLFPKDAAFLVRFDQDSKRLMAEVA